MQRLFTKNASGVAPDGKFYAGDVNVLEDAVAAASDFTQTIDVSTLRVGDTGLLIVKYGTNEFRLSGSVRTDGILRALGGLYAGAFTTTQRDAIASGSRPYGLVILNTTTNQYEWNSGSDATPDWKPFGAVSDGVGNLATRPAANSVPAGTHFFAVDQIAEYVSDGSSWYRTSVPAGTTVSWYKPDAAAPAGWVKYDGGNLPSSTGIYADLATHLGSSTTPDTRGRMEVAIGAHADVNAVGNNDGQAAANRRPKHRTTNALTASQVPHAHGPGGAAAGGWFEAEWGSGAAGQGNGGGSRNQGTVSATDTQQPAVTLGGSIGTNNANDALDTPSYIVTCKIAKL